MVITFQILLILMIILFGLGLMSFDIKENKQCYAAVVIASIIAMTVTFYVG
jgi:hypothetical protein